MASGGLAAFGESTDVIELNPEVPLHPLRGRAHFHSFLSRLGLLACFWTASERKQKENGEHL